MTSPFSLAAYARMNVEVIGVSITMSQRLAESDEQNFKHPYCSSISISLFTRAYYVQHILLGAQGLGLVGFLTGGQAITTRRRRTLRFVLSETQITFEDTLEH